MSLLSGGSKEISCPSNSSPVVGSLKGEGCTAVIATSAPDMLLSESEAKELHNSTRPRLVAKLSTLPDLEIHSDLNSRSAKLSSLCLNTSVAVPEERERERDRERERFCLTPVQGFALRDWLDQVIGYST